jgi:hypothetical protein
LGYNQSGLERILRYVPGNRTTTQGSAAIILYESIFGGPTTVIILAFLSSQKLSKRL